MLPYAHFRPALLREVRPAGWLNDFLVHQSAGLTGNVAVSGYPYGYKFWGSHEGDVQGSYGAWWPYEQTGYWIDGALKCGYLAGDEALYIRALEEIDFAIDNAAPDGFIGPDTMREEDRWPYAVFFRAVLAQYEISGDRRYLEAMLRHYLAASGAPAPHPMGWDRDVTGVEILVALYQECGQPELLALAEDLFARFNHKWPEHDCSLPTLLSDKRPTEHGVTFNEQAKLPALLYQATGNPQYLLAAQNGFAKLDRYARLADGLHSCSEHILSNTTRDMHETCDITDHTWALNALLHATGEARYADQIERVIFNALPGAITKDFRALQYFSCPNQVVATSSSLHNRFMRGINWMSYRPDHEVQCCPGNLHRAMPNYIARMWLRTPQGGIVAALYGPGSLETTAGPEQTTVYITAETRYPFEQAVRFTLEPERPVTFPFGLRIPGWCRQARILINGAEVQADLAPGTFFTIEREWQPRDVVTVELPFSLAVERWPDGGISLTYGPLTLALPVPARAEIESENSTVRQQMETLGPNYKPRPVVVKPDFPAYNLYPAGPWNYALCENALDAARVEWNPVWSDPFDAENPPLRVYVKARRVRGWRVIHTRRARQFGHWTEGSEFCRGLRTITGDFYFTPALPNPHTLSARLADTVEEICLAPYGATLLRLTVFPTA